MVKLTRGVDTDRRCPDCGADDLFRHTDKVQTGPNGRDYVTEERFACPTCLHGFVEEYDPGEVPV